MKKHYTWDEYRTYLESSLNKDFVDAYYEKLFSKVMPVMKALAPHIDHKAMWEKTKDTFTKELILYCWNKSKYRTTQHELGYRDEDVEHLVYDVLKAEGVKCKFV